MDTVKTDPGSDPLLISDEHQIKEEEPSVLVKEEDTAEVKQETENEVIIEDHQLEDLKSSDTANSYDSGYNEIVSADQHEVTCYKKEPQFNILEPPDIDFTVEKCYVCERCHRKFTTWAALKSHSTNVHCNNKPYKCNLCQRTFMYYGSFKLHSGLPKRREATQM